MYKVGMKVKCKVNSYNISQNLFVYEKGKIYKIAESPFIKGELIILNENYKNDYYWIQNKYGGVDKSIEINFELVKEIPQGFESTEAKALLEIGYR